MQNHLRTFTLLAALTAIFVGVLTAIGGGLMRDVIVGQVPEVLRRELYVVPALLGGPNSRWFTEIIYNWFFEGGNWNQGAAYAFILLVLCVGFILLMMRLFKVGLTDVAK